MIKDVVLAGPARTPIGALSGALSTVPAPTLGSVAARAALERARVRPEEVTETIFGNVLGAGLGQNVARQVAIGAGVPVSVGATTVNKVCGSGLKAVMLASQAIQLGDADIVMAGGTESMSGAPYLLPRARAGYRMGHGELVDSMIRDGLWDVYNDVHMGNCGDRCAADYGFSREAQDDFAVASYTRALAARDAGITAREIAPVEVPGRKGRSTTVSEDEEPARFDESKLRAMRPAFSSSGTVTAGNASSVNDGAAAILVLSREAAERLGVAAEARVAGHATAAQAPELFTTAPIAAIRALLKKLSWSAAEVDVFEINEAFASVALAAMRDLEIPHERLNVHGGAIALGHPIGASGTRTLVTLLAAMRERDARRGVVSLCIGGGEAVAVAVERV